jgi:hypothetical protein
MATKYNDYEESESSGGSGSDDDGPKNEYITAKKIKLPSHLQVGGIGDDEENSDNDEYDDDDEDEDPDEPNLEHLETEVAMKNAFFDNSDDDEEDGDNSDDEEAPTDTITELNDATGTTPANTAESAAEPEERQKIDPNKQCLITLISESAQSSFQIQHHNTILDLQL